MVTSVTKGSAATVPLIAVLLAVTACTGARPGPTATTLQEPAPLPTSTKSISGYDEFRNEYQRASDELATSMPPDQQIPAQPPGEWDTGGRFEEGVGSMQAALYWQCAWLGAYATAAESGDSETAGLALDRLTEWTSLPQVRTNIDTASIDAWQDAFIGPARTGSDDKLLELARSCR